MHNRLLRIALFLFLGTSTSLAACSAKELDGGSRRVIFIRAALAPPAAPRAGGACTYAPDVSAAALFTGTVDVGLRDDYALTVLVQSVDKAVSTSISAANVMVTDPDGTLIREFTQTATGFVDAGGYGLTSFIAMDAPTSDILRTNLPNRSASRTVVVHVNLVGNDPATGSATSSPDFQFPVRVCNGCLVDFSTGNDDLSPVQPNCNKTSSADQAVPCALGQDEVVACQLCRNRPACDPTTP